MDWIVRNLFMAGPLMDGHQQAQSRVSNKGLVFLRAFCIAAANSGMLGIALAPSAIAGLDGLSVPSGEHDTSKASREIGSLFAPIFKAETTVLVDQYSVTLEIVTTTGSEGGKAFQQKRYTVSRSRE